MAAWEVAHVYLRKMPFDDATYTNVRYRAMTAASNMIWMARPWRWTLGALTNFTLTDTTQDYTQAPPSDFLYVQLAYVTDANQHRPLHVAPFLPPTEVISAGWPSFIAYVGSNTFRFFPRPGTFGGTTTTAVALYKKTAPLITSSNASNAGVLVMDDEWFHVYTEALLYWAWKYGFDDREGQAQFDVAAAKAILGGQHARVMALIEDMAQREPLFLELDFTPEREARRK